MKINNLDGNSRMQLSVGTPRGGEKSFLGEEAVKTDLNQIKKNLISYIHFKNRQSSKIEELQFLATDYVINSFDSLHSIKVYLLNCLCEIQSSKNNEKNSDLARTTTRWLNKSIQILDNSNLNCLEKINLLRKKIEKSSNILEIVNKCEGFLAISAQLSNICILNNWSNDLIKLIAIKALSIDSDTILYSLPASREVNIDSRTLYLPLDEDLKRSIMMHGHLFPSSLFLEDKDLLATLPSKNLNEECFVSHLVREADKALASKIPYYKALDESELNNLLQEYFAIPNAPVCAEESKLLDSDTYRKERRDFLKLKRGKKKAKFLKTTEEKDLLKKFKFQQLIQIRLERIYQQCPALRLIPFFSVNCFNPAADYNRALFSNFFDVDGTNQTPYRMKTDARHGTHYRLNIDNEANSMKFLISKKYFITKLNSEGTIPELFSHFLSWEITIPLHDSPIQSLVYPIEMRGTNDLSEEDGAEILWMLNLREKINF